MSRPEERIIGAVVMHALRGGLQIEVIPFGAKALLKVTNGLQHASLSLKLDAGLDLIGDADGDDELYAPLLEVAQGVYDEMLREE